MVRVILVTAFGSLAEIKERIMIDLNHFRNLAVCRRAGYFRVAFLSPVLVVGLSFGQSSQLMGQIFGNLHVFSATSTNSIGVQTNSDGISPTSLALSGDTLYGVTLSGGGSGNGTVFKLKTDGTGFSTLYRFATGFGYDTFVTNSDGAYPTGLIASNDTLYGITQTGGSSARGTVFKLNSSGIGFATLHSFTIGSDGGKPNGQLILLGSTLYGTTQQGGDSQNGTVFAVSTDGTNFRTLYSFTAVNNYINIDGAIPAELVATNNTLYGTTITGGSSGNGTVFAVNNDGSDFRILHNFSEIAGCGFCGDGLVVSGNTLYGTRAGRVGPGLNGGIVFKINTDGTGFMILNNLPLFGHYTLGLGSLTLSGETLYGTFDTDDLDCRDCASFHLFALNINGTGVIAEFPASLNFVIAGKNLYGTTIGGGHWGSGAVFSFWFTPQVTITPAGANASLSWPTNYAGFDYTGFTLQSTTNLSSSIWTTSLPAPVVVNGQYTVTNPISGSQQFFRLTQ